MTNEIKAAFIVAFIVAAGGVIVVLGTYLPWFILPVLGIGYMIYLMYQLILTKLNTDVKVSEIK